MTQLTTFNFRDNNVRVIDINGEPWFIASDACRCLDLPMGNGAFMHLKKLSADEKRPVPPNAIWGKGGRNVTIISESGLYKLIMRSDKPAARIFQDWVTREVLPTIRKTGAFGQNEVTPEAILQQHLGH